MVQALHCTPLHNIIISVYIIFYTLRKEYHRNSNKVTYVYVVLYIQYLQIKYTILSRNKFCDIITYTLQRSWYNKTSLPCITIIIIFIIYCVHNNMIPYRPGVCACVWVVVYQLGRMHNIIIHIIILCVARKLNFVCSRPDIVVVGSRARYRS